jgi:hypothetical protein
MNLRPYAALALLLTACGSHNSLSGDVGGRAFPFGDAVFTLVQTTDASGTSGVSLGGLYVTSTPDACAELANGIFHQDATVLVSELLIDDPAATAPQVVQFGNGSYAIEDPSVIAAQLDSTEPRPVNVGELVVAQYDSYCQLPAANHFLATSGTLTVANYRTNDSMDVTLDITLANGDRLRGQLTARYCAYADVLFSDDPTGTTTATGQCLP